MPRTAPSEFVRQSRLRLGSPVHTKVDSVRVKPMSEVEPTSKFVVPVLAAAGTPIPRLLVVPPLNV